MNRHIIGSLWDRNNRNGVNKNFEYLFEGSNRIDELNYKADKILRDAEVVNQNNNNTNERLDRIIADSGTSSTEVVDARGDFPVLRSRLLDIDQTIKDVELTPEFIGAVGDGVHNDFSALKNALESISGKTIKFNQGSVYAFDKKIVVDGLSNFIVDFNGATLLDLGAEIPVDGGLANNPVGIQFINCDNFEVKGLIHNTKNAEYGRVPHDQAHLKSASVEFKKCKNFHFQAPLFLGSQGSIPFGGYPYHMTLDNALNFGHLKVYECENIVLDAFNLQGGLSGNEVLVFGKSKNIKVLNSEKGDNAEMASWGKFIQCSNLEFTQDVFETKKSTSFIDVSGDNLEFKNMTLNAPNGKFLDITNEWGEIGGDTHTVIADNIKGEVNQVMFCSTMAMPFAPENAQEFISFIKNVHLKNSTFDGGAVQHSTVFGTASRFINMTVDNCKFTNFDVYFNNQLREDNWYHGDYVRTFNDTDFVVTESFSDIHMMSGVGLNTFNNCKFDMNYNGKMRIFDNHAYTKNINVTETNFVFNSCTFKDADITLDAHTKFNDCKFVNCTFDGGTVLNIINAFNSCAFKWDSTHYNGTKNPRGPFRSFGSKQLDFNDCKFKGTPRADSSYFVEVLDWRVDLKIDFKSTDFNLSRLSDAQGGTGLLILTQIRRDLLKRDIQIDYSFRTCNYKGEISASDVYGYTKDAHVKSITFKMYDSISELNVRDYTINYVAGNEFSDFEMILANNTSINDSGIINPASNQWNWKKYLNVKND